MLSAQNDEKKNIMTEKRQHVVPTQEGLSWSEEPGTRRGHRGDARTHRSRYNNAIAGGG